MPKVTYLGPSDSQDVPALGWRSFPRDEAVDVDEEYADIAASLAQVPDMWKVTGLKSTHKTKADETADEKESS